ncbi:MAG: TolC family protein [Acidaminococcaceae bacterium]|nr:TolC family protein [Acidaminococcaceae bacterium]
MEMKKTARTALLSALFTALLVPAAFAQETLPIDLQTAIDKAFATHADIKKAEYSLDAARADYNAARESFGPQISLTHNTSRGGYWDDGQTINNNYNNSVGLSVPVFNASLNAAEKQAKARYQSSVLGEEQAFITLKHEVSNAYYTLLAAIDAQQVCEQSVTALEDHLKNVQAQYDVGVVAKVDLLRSEVELTSAQQDLIKADNRHSIAEARLNNLMGINQDTKLAPVEELKYTVYGETLPHCIDYAMLHSLELQRSRLQVKAAEAALNSAKANWIPSVAGTVSNGWNNGHWPGDDNSNWSAGFRFTMNNIFDSGVTKSKVASAKAALMSAKESYRQDTDALELEVRNCYNTLREAEKRISTTQVAVAKAEEDYHIAQVRYEAGVGTNTDVLDAQVALHQARNNYNTALYDYNLAIVALDSAMGIEARPADYKYLTYGERYKATKAAYDAAVETTDSDKALKETVKTLEQARKERRKAASAAKK